MGHLDLTLGDVQRLRGDTGQHGIEALTNLGARVQDPNNTAVIRRDFNFGDAGAGVAMAEGCCNASAAHRGGTGIDTIGVRSNAF
jgi:hypothetical protein